MHCSIEVVIIHSHACSKVERMHSRKRWCVGECIGVHSSLEIWNLYNKIKHGTLLIGVEWCMLRLKDPGCQHYV